MRFARTIPLWCGVALCASFAAQASEAPAEATQPVAGQAQAGTSNDVAAGIDAKTKKLRRLTAAESRALAEKAAAMPRRAGSQWDNAPKTASEARATQRIHAGGAVSMRVPTEAMSQLMVSRDANGQLHFSEGDTAHQVTQEVSE